jgi:predicted metal-dependent HD superfamily phosphohydrolase
MVDSLAEEWEQLERDLGWPAGASATLRDELLAAYGEAHRRYHGVDHVASVLATLSELTAPRTATPAARLAAWFHDAVYDPARFDNEELSAELAVDRLTALGTDAGLVAEVRTLVLATKRHEVPATAAPVTDHDELLDADMAILASPPATYEAYTAAIRAEYGHLDDAVFRAGRAAVLRTFLARPAIFTSAAGAQRFEARARANVAAELDRLDGGRPVS